MTCQRACALLFVAWALMLTYGSWHPFRVGPDTVGDAWKTWLANGSAKGQSVSDLAVNLFAGVPLGFLGVMAIAKLKRFHTIRMPSVLIVLIVIVAISLVVELGQCRIVGRTSSMNDTVAQVMGGLLGSLIAWFAGDWIRGRLDVMTSSFQEAQSKATALLQLYAAGYCLWMLIPFAPVSLSELAAKWRTGMISMTAFAEFDPWQVTYTLAVSSVAAVPIGWLVAQFFLNISRSKNWLAAISVAVAVVVSLEFLQIFVESRVAALDDAIGSAAGALIGVWLFARVSEAPDHFESGSLAGLVPTLCALLLTVAYIAVALAPFDLATTSSELRMNLQRFESSNWLEGNSMLMVSNLFRSFLWSIALGGSMGWVVSQSKTYTKALWVGACIASVIICVGTEAMQFLSLQHDPSVLDAIARLLGVVVGLFIARLFQFDANHMTLANSRTKEA
ncbi:VanZ like family protein [Rubripirellula amarantea]|uniref:VanZ like family protein n=1 Tax=Rubripirellula amarantea TaxID=2527999 RepID=A0A5C5WVS3_9BACT|nr:VanZ family protein [Rubripirellula amarantea]TWT54660.1 VanZ like family protein [Rubripirellula amarantea]